MPGIRKYYFDLGYDILKPDARGHGMSGGDYIGYGWHERKDYLDWIKDKKEDTIFLHGFSMENKLTQTVSCLIRGIVLFILIMNILLELLI
jgi:hypothetical protein